MAISIFSSRELDETALAMKTIEDDKHRLHASTDNLQTELEVSGGIVGVKG